MEVTKERAALTEKAKAAPGIAKYVSYREYLRDLFQHKKSLNPRFSFRRFAEIAGFKSPNYLQLIIEGKRRLTEDSAKDLGIRLKLSPAERGLFVALVRMDNASTENERTEAERARLRCIRQLLTREIPSAQAEVLSGWYHLLVRELFLIPDMEPTGRWISERLAGIISTSQAEESIQLLLKAGFLKFANGRYSVTEPVLSTEESAFQHAMMQEHHAALLSVWAKNINRLCPNEQELGVLNIPISSKKIPELRKRIRQFQDEIIGWLQDENEADRVVQLGTYLMPFPGDDISE